MVQNLWTDELTAVPVSLPDDCQVSGCAPVMPPVCSGDVLDQDVGRRRDPARSSSREVTVHNRGDLVDADGRDVDKHGSSLVSRAHNLLGHEITENEVRRS